MLQIRLEQIEAFERAAREQFLREMATHVRTHFPDVAGDDPVELRGRLDGMVAAAATHGLQSKRDVCLYIDLAMVLGDGFERRPETAWALRYLSDSRVSDPSLRLRRLHDEVAFRAEVAARNRRLKERHA
jgi:hypothetical protein